MTNITRHITDRQNIITSRSSIIMLCFSIITLSLLNITFLTGTILGIPISTVSALSYQNSTDVSFTFDPILSISVSPDSITIPTIAPGTTDTSNTITVNVSTNTAYGYSLLASVGNNTQYNTSDLVHNDSTMDSTFTSISPTASLSSLTDDNTWGYSTSLDNGSTWSTYHGLPLYSAVGNNTATDNPALLIDTTSPADSKSIDFRIAARASSTQPSGTYSNVINFYAVGEPMPLPPLYDEVAKMNKGTQTLAQIQETITAPTTTDYTADTSNSGVYEYNSSVFGEASDASNANKIYYYRGVLEPEADQGSYGSDGKATTYPNYVKLGNDTCWRIVRTTGSGGVKMVYNGTWTGSTCANSTTDAQTAAAAFNGKGTSSKPYWYKNIHYVGYTFNNNVTDSTAETPVDTVFGSDANPSLNNTRSKIKTYIEDTWYASNMTAYTNLLEPAAGYCNDRTAYSDRTTTTALSTIVPYKTSNAAMYFGAYGRNMNAANAGKTPSLTCPRNTVDLYRYVPNSTGVSNELKYPAALLTADELSLAGSGISNISPQGSSYNAKSYLRSGNNFWLLSPYLQASGGDAYGSELYSGGFLASNHFPNPIGVRPAISLKPGTTVASGTGTSEDPWVVPAL